MFIFSFVLCSFFPVAFVCVNVSRPFTATQFAATSSITNLERNRELHQSATMQVCSVQQCVLELNINLLRAEGLDRGASNGGIEASGISILGSAAINRSHSRARQAALPAPRVAFPSVRTISATDLKYIICKANPQLRNRYDDSLQTAEPPSASKPGTALEPSQLDRTCPPHCDQERAVWG